MMAVSNAVQQSNGTEDQAYRAEPPNPQNSNAHDSYIYGQLIRDQLEYASKNQNTDQFITLLNSIVHPGVDDNGKPKPIDAPRLLVVIRTLSRDFGRLDQQVLVPVCIYLLDIEKWASLGSNLSDTFLQFFSVLVSVNPKWWSEVAKRVIAQLPNTSARLDLVAHHSAIKQIMQNVPISSAAFGSLFDEFFPHKSSSSEEIGSYVANLLKITEYGPDQALAIWRIVVTRLVELDVECEIADLISDFDSGDESSDDEESEDDDESDLGESDESGDDEDEGEVTQVDLKRKLEEEESNKRLRLESVNDGEEITGVELDLAGMNQEPMSKKVDFVMTLILEYLKRQFTEERILSGGSTPLFKILLQVFKEVVLPTSRLQSVQFLWFFVVHGHKDLMASYISVLLETALSSTVALDQRCRAMQYVASFVARARGLSRSQVVFVVGFLADWVHRYIKEREQEVDETASMARFRLLYSAVQALLYIFVFRHSMLRMDGRWEADIDKLFQQAIHTKFNPLQYCQPEVVAMFARIAQDEEVASCYSIIERNRWGRFRTAESSERSKPSGLFDNNRDFKLYDSFFPFEPLRLPSAKGFVAEYYEKWSDVSDSESDCSE